MIVIVDYGMGNVGSIQNILRRVGKESVISSDPKQIEQAEKLILPGVGAFDIGMKNIKERNLLEVLNYKALVEKVPVLGICLGMQLMTYSSDEGNLAGLGWMRARTVSFRKLGKLGLKIPHMGWNQVQVVKQTPLTSDWVEEPRFYFVHSYYVECEDPGLSLLRTHYGVEFDSGFVDENIMGVQFHPEKSHRFGIKLMENFAKIGFLRDLEIPLSNPNHVIGVR